MGRIMLSVLAKSIISNVLGLLLIEIGFIPVLGRSNMVQCVLNPIIHLQLIVLINLQLHGQ